MPDLNDGQIAEVKGSAKLPYILKNTGGVYSCTCPAWRNQSEAIERRTCKHLRAFRGEQAEQDRIGGELPAKAAAASANADAPGLLLAHTWENDTDLRRQDKSDLWQSVRFLVFDLPAAAAPFEERLAQLRERLPPNQSPFAEIHTQERCRGTDHLREELARVEALGGEGLMLRQPGSRYEMGRSPTLLKVKTFHDAEARVVEHLPGTGRHKGRLGALMVELPDGTNFAIGTGLSDAQREHPPAIGSMVTFRYQELSDRGVPRFPSFVRVHPQ